jgi:CCR4-NOT transcriptional complex subunit CAF120
MEGWVRIRVAGQTDWKRVWMVVSAGQQEGPGPDVPPNGSGSQTQMTRKKRMSNLFSRDQSPPRSTGPVKPAITMYAGQKPKERKKPLLSFRDVAQAFSVYPERPELISRSTLIKVEGLLGDEEMAQSMKSREGWLLFMPEIEGATGNQAAEMLKWVIGK